MGSLIIDGTIELAQFWPTGESDGDVTKLVLDIRSGSIRYKPLHGSEQTTTIFDDACVKSFGLLKPVIKNGKLTVRLQGIDAPELHFQPQSMKGIKYKGYDLGSLKGSGLVKQYRQHQAETATVLLGAYLSTLGTSSLHCQFFTQVRDDEGPCDAIDRYGRFVGDLLIEGINLNLELLRRGQAIISLYDSMSRSEMEAYLAAWEAGKSATSNIVRYLTNSIEEFDPILTFSPPSMSSIRPEGKTKKFIHPKLYRRYCTWWAYRKLGTFKYGFETFLTLFNDGFYELANFIEDGSSTARLLPLAKMVRTGKIIQYEPDEIVFKESPSKLNASDGKVIDHWQFGA